MPRTPPLVAAPAKRHARRGPGAGPAVPRSAGGPVRARFARWVTWAVMGYGALAAAAWLAVWVLAERWWPATVYLFGPRWVVLLPLAVLLPAAALLRPRLLPALALVTLVVLFPVMGLRTGWRSWLPAGASAPRLRVVTLNAAGRDDVGNGLAPLLLEWKPELVAVQECSAGLAAAFAELPGWHFDARGQLCLLSRYPIRAPRSLDRGEMAAVREEGVGGSGAAVRYRVETPQGPVAVANVHLETPRKGFSRLFDGDASQMAGNTLLREIESRRISRWVGRDNPSLIVLGDFNMPTESRIYRQGWGDLANAFSRTGRGPGWTRDNGWIQVRIDHVLTGSGWRARRAWVGPDVGSDHRPVGADLQWTGEE